MPKSLPKNNIGQYYVPGTPINPKNKRFFTNEEIELLLFDIKDDIVCGCGAEVTYGVPAPGHMWYCDKYEKK